MDKYTVYLSKELYKELNDEQYNKLINHLEYELKNHLKQEGIMDWTQ